jgi:murein L,D-transpeptidase YcbB/YkuD
MIPMTYRRTAVLFLLPFAFSGCSRKQTQLGQGRPEGPSMPPAVSTLLRTAIESGALPADSHHQKERVRAFEETRDFYRKRHYEPAWSDTRGPLPRAQELVAAIDGLGSEALDPAEFDREGLADLLREATWEGKLGDPTVERRLADLDLTLTYNFLVMAASTATGRLQPDTLQTDWYTKPRTVDLDVVLTRALGPDGIQKALASVAPPNPAYVHLREAFARYGEIVKRGGWPQIPAGPRLALGATGERVHLLRTRLAVEGDLPNPAPPPAAPAAPATPAETSYDEALASVVARFQGRHGIKPSGAVDDETLEALNVPAAARRRQIAVNMERWRWLPTDFGSRYILVNVPQFELTMFDGGQKALRMRVVVGKAQSRTPAFSNRITRIDFNPVWHLPPSIVQNEIAPAMAKDPGYLARKNLEVVKLSGDSSQAVDPGEVDWTRMGKGDYPYRVRQPSGPDNALGRIKFVIPDQFDVYLHGTPSQRAFNSTERDLSHGCVRLERPAELAAYLLKDDPKWSPEAIQDAIDSEDTQSIPLKAPLPVHILYWTAWVDDDGAVQFRKDIYGHDGDLEKALAAEPKVRIDPAALRGEKRAEARSAGAQRSLQDG